LIDPLNVNILERFMNGALREMVIRQAFSIAGGLTATGVALALGAKEFSAPIGLVAWCLASDQLMRENLATNITRTARHVTTLAQLRNFRTQRQP
jgi:hypothetical protein